MMRYEISIISHVFDNFVLGRQFPSHTFLEPLCPAHQTPRADVQRNGKKPIGYAQGSTEDTATELHEEFLSQPRLLGQITEAGMEASNICSFIVLSHHLSRIPEAIAVCPLERHGD